jgi:hypothetical protein
MFNNPENDKNNNNEESDLLRLDNTFSIKNGLLGVNRIIFLKLLKCFKTKNIRRLKQYD